MRQLAGSIFSRKELLTGKDWYHQRFDGAPMFIFAIADAEMLREKRKPEAAYPKLRVCIFEGGRADWHLEMADLRSCADALVAMAGKDPGLAEKLLGAWKADEARFEDFFWREFPAIDLPKLSDRALLRLWKRYYRLALRALSSTAIIDHFALGTDGLIHEIVERETGAGEEELPGIFSVATAPVYQSFVNQAEIELLGVVSGQSGESIEEYQRRYFWISNNFLRSHILPVTYFEAAARARRESGKDLAGEIARMEAAPAANRQKKEEMFRRYGFSPLLRTLLKISEEFTAWQDERKRATQWNIYIGSRMLEEIAPRTGYGVEELTYTTGFEIEDVFAGRGIPREELRARKEGSVFLTTPHGYYVASGANVDAVRKLMRGEPLDAGVKNFRGLTASLGKAQGRVKIIKSVDEMHKMAQGDILVAVMTRPDYVPAMKTAAAIVTNEGGITSHAAIVSRELGIPCIIGTKIATEVLRDGDLVEVNADRSTVTILEKA